MTSYEKSEYMESMNKGENAILSERMTLAAANVAWSEAVERFDQLQTKRIVDSAEGQRSLEAFAKVANYASEVEPKNLFVDRRWLDDSRSIPAEKGVVLARMVNTALLTLAAERKLTDNFAEDVIRLSFGGGLAIERARRVALGRPVDAQDDLLRVLLPGKPGPKPGGPLDDEWDDRIPPEFIEQFDRINEWGAIRDLTGALAKVGAIATEIPRPREKSGALIGGFNPMPVCLGAASSVEVAINGKGFGSQRPGDAVYADDVKLEVSSWSENRIVARIPAGFKGGYCVSVMENAGGGNGGKLGELHSAAMELDEVIAGNFSWDYTPIAPGLLGLYTPRARCGASNTLWVGPPRIDRLQAGGVDAPGAVKWRPRRPLQIAWSVTEAKTISLSIQPLGATTAAQLPSIPDAIALPAAGQRELPARWERAPWSGRIVLRASNACGAVERHLDIEYAPQLGFVAVGVGSRSIFHAGVLAYTRPWFASSFAVTGGSGLGAVAAVHAATTANAAPLDAFWERLITGNSRLYPKLGLVERAFQDFKEGSYDQLLDAISDFADEVLLRFASQPAIPGRQITVGATGEQTATDAGKVLLKSLPYAIKVAKAILVAAAEGATGSTAVNFLKASKVVGAIETPAEFISAGNLSKQIQESFVAGFKAGLPMVIGLANPIAGAAVGLVIAVVFEIAATIEREDEKRRFISALGVAGFADPTAVHAALDAWLAAIGLAGNAMPPSATRIRLSVGVLESGSSSYITERGLIDAPPNATSGAGTIVPAPWSMLIRAATALPGLLAPVQVSTGVNSSSLSLIDGATTDPSALAAVIEAGADEVIMSVPVRMNLQAAPPFAAQNFIAVMRRAALMREGSFASAAIDAFAHWREHLSPTVDVGDYYAGLHVIDATIELPYLSALDTDPGLLDIWRDYGYMRAFDTLAPLALEPDRSGVDPLVLLERRALMMIRLDGISSAITLLRITAWEMEHALSGVGLPTDSGFNAVIGVSESWQAAEPLRRLKGFIANAIRERLVMVRQFFSNAPVGARWPGPATPQNAQAWANLFERHIWSFETVQTDGGGAPSGPFQRLIFFSLTQVNDQPTRPTTSPLETGRIEPTQPPAIDPSLFSPA
jgi:hypothetical protein